MQVFVDYYHSETRSREKVSLFDKLKQGVSEAGTKAINVVEANRLKASISKNNEQIHSLYTEIGKKVFSGYNNQQFHSAMVEDEIKQIQALYNHNRQLDIDIKAIWNEKECPCGNSVSLDAKFCSNCGHRFNLVTIEETPNAPVILEQSQQLTVTTPAREVSFSDSAANTNITGICPNCDSEIEADSKFCGECGHML